MSQAETRLLSIGEVVVPKEKVLGELPPPKLAVAPKIWKVGEAELEGLCEKSVPLMKDEFPRLEVRRMVNFLRSSMGDNRSKLIRTEHAWLCATIVQTFLEPEPVVTTTILCSFDSRKGDAQWLVKEAIAWAKSLRAVKFVLSNDVVNYDVELVGKKLGLVEEFSSFSVVL
jgi:hypothetical protein